MVEVEVALVRAAIFPFEMSFAVFKTLVESPLESTAVWPYLQALPMLLIVVPHTLVLTALGDC